MKKHSSTLSSAISAAMLAAFLGGCGGDSPDQLIASGKDFLAKNDSKAAVIQLKNALQADPNLGEARFLLGKALLASGDVAGAEVELRKALNLKFSNDDVVPLLAQTMLSAGQAQKVTDEFGKLELGSNVSKAALKTTLSMAWANLGKREAAEAELAAALALQPDYVPARISDARIRASSGKLDEARSIVDKILADHPNDHDALLLRGSLQSAMGSSDDALVSYRKAIAAKPDFLLAHSAAISTLLQQQKVDDASKQIEELKKVAPKHPQTLYFDAQSAYQRKDFKTARERVQQLLKVAPDNPNALQLAGAVEFQLRSFIQAETYLSKALQRIPELTLARRLLISTHLRSGQPAKALSALQPVIDKLDTDPTLLSLAGEIYLQNGDPGKAADYFTKASKLDPNSAARKISLAIARLAQGNTGALAELEQIAGSDSGTTADLALVAAYLQTGQLDKALKAIDSLEKKDPDNPAPHNLRARTLLGKRDIAGARASFEKALAVNPTFFPAASSLAALDLADKKPEDARKRFDKVLAADPKNVQALLAQAELRATSGGSAEEVSALISKAISADPGETAPRLALIQYHLQSKNPKKAMAAANEAVSALPDKPEILDALGRTQHATGDMNQALTTFGKLAAMQPSSPMAHMRMAEVHIANKNRDEAAKSIQKALEIKPDMVDAQRAQILMAIEAGKIKDAVQIARVVQKQRPKEAVGFVLEGDIHGSQKAWADAIVAYRNGLKLTASPELAVKLHSALIAAGNTGEAERTAAAWTKDHPNDIKMRIHLGDLATSRKEFAVAAQHYQNALELQPNNAMVLNNLAWVAGRLKSPKAVEYAEKANQLTPNQPAFMDTLAMLLADKGETTRAIELLRKSMEIAPQAASIQLNLARVLISSGKKDEARKELEALARLGDKFPGQAEVANLQKQL